jgi:hypothetical protein
MKSNSLVFRKFVYLTFFAVLCCLVYSSTIGVALGQKKPKSVPLDPNIDDRKLCSEQLKGTQFCDFFDTYDRNVDTGDAAKDTIARNARNDMIMLVRGQVDSYFKMRKDGKSTKVRWLQTLLDFLEVGAATAITIMNGERAKTVVGAALNGFQGGRTAFNKNFEILQLQTLINKMINKRATTFTEILKSMDKPVRAPKQADSYSWYEAKNDLRRYLLAGTFNDALDSLVRETGADAERAQRRLEIVEQGTTFGEISDAAVATSRNATGLLNKEFVEALAKPADSKEYQNAETTLRAIVTALNEEDPKIKAALEKEKLTATSKGEDIRAGLLKIKGIFVRAVEDEELITVIDQTVVDIYEKNK